MQTAHALPQSPARHPLHPALLGAPYLLVLCHARGHLPKEAATTGVMDEAEAQVCQEAEVQEGMLVHTGDGATHAAQAVPHLFQRARR